MAVFDPSEFTVAAVSITRLSVADSIVMVDLVPAHPREGEERVAYNFTFKMCKPPKELDYQGSILYENPRARRS